MREIGNPFFIGDQAGGTQVSGWLNAWSPKPSAYAVAAHRPDDVVGGSEFRRYPQAAVGGQRRRPFLSGHIQRAGLAADLDAADARDHLHDAFTPAGSRAAPVPAVTIEAGAMWVDAYDA